ncbi:hypothetical protein BV898_02779 [Hypsibius exemplaris]|uniref:G-protein coupled receptors family 1 profile domain-containing protein n=1 Tax=Hypsibius exemplaris TaxID=2072580 RepID=A0A1W0X7U9_HYPEX|nr:hypothetical protein BV898_02779 [Hypsibius exemplaris]
MSSLNSTANSSHHQSFLWTTAANNNCSLSPGQLYSLNILPLTLSAVIIFAQSFNLVIFHFWQIQEPFVLLHIAHACPSLLLGVTSLGTPLVRMFPWHETVSGHVTMVFVHAYQLWMTLSLVTLVAINVDRWLSVEFPAEYRRRMSHRRYVRILVLSAWVLTLLLTAPGFIRYWHSSVVSCAAPLQWKSGSVLGLQAWKIIIGPVILGLLIFFQARIVVIAVKRKAKEMLAKRRVTVSAAADARPVRIVWRSLRASMMLTLIGVVTFFPFGQSFGAAAEGSRSFVCAAKRLCRDNARVPREEEQTETVSATLLAKVKELPGFPPGALLVTGTLDVASDDAGFVTVSGDLS